MITTKARSPGRELDPDVLRIDAARHVGRLRTLDDRATVREQRDRLRLRAIRQLRPKQEFVCRHRSMTFQSCGERREVDRGGLVAGSKLHRVATAQDRHGRSGRAVKVVESTTHAARAIGTFPSIRDVELKDIVAPDVDLQKLAIQLIEAARQDLEAFRYLKAADDRRQGTKYAGRVASRRRSRRRRFIEQAAETGRRVVLSLGGKTMPTDPTAPPYTYGTPC